MLCRGMFRWWWKFGVAAISVMALIALVVPTTNAVGTASSATHQVEIRAKAKKPSKTKKPAKVKWNPNLFIPKLPIVRDSGPPLFKFGCHVGPLVTTAAPCEFGSKNKRRVLLFGDSHAAHWFGPLDRIRKNTNRFQLATLTKAACAAVDYSGPIAPAPVVTIPGEMVAPDKVENCKAWRKDALDKLSRQEFGKFDLVILSPIVPGENSSKSRFQGWKAGYLRTLNIVAKSTPKVLILRDMPYLSKSKDVVKCIAKHKGKAAQKCGAKPKRALNPKAWKITQQVAAKFRNVQAVDLATKTCTKTLCSPIEGRLIKVRDSHHYVHPYMTRKLYFPLRKPILTRV